MRASSVELDARIRGGLGGTYCDLSDGVTHYGLSGPAAVLVHGGTVPLWIWDGLAARLSNDGFRVLRYDHFHRSFLSMLRSDALGNYDAACQAVGQQDRDILLIWGEGDAEITAAMTADVQRFIPRLHFKPVADAGHGVVLEKLALVNEIVLEFLRGKPAADMDASGHGFDAQK
jgi:hypothetical protein